MKMLLQITIIFTIVAIINGETFNNPIFEDSYSLDPGAIKVNGMYYIATSSQKSKQALKFPIHISSDLDTWTYAGCIFDENNLPSWSNKEQEFWAPEIHQIGNNFHVYFTTRHIGTNRSAIGVAVASTPMGLYRATDRPILLIPTRDVYDSTIINSNGSLYLIWASDHSINGRKLDSDGLSFDPESLTVQLLVSTLAWENSNIEAPWHIERNGYHYLMYSGNLYCNELRGVGVARSLSPLGPYEKRGAPFYVTSNDFKGPSHNSIVKDLYDTGDVIVAHAFSNNKVCGSWPFVAVLATLGWGDDHWPNIQQ